MCIKHVVHTLYCMKEGKKVATLLGCFAALMGC